MLEVRNCSVSIGSRTLIDRQSMRIRPGELTGLVAPNGSGKTTFMRFLAGASVARATGEVLVDGRVPRGEPEYRRSVFYVPGDASILYPLLTVRENLLMAHRCWGGRRDLDKVADACRMRDFLDKRVCRLSLGMKQQASLAAGYLTGARYLLLDEPMNALDPTNLKVNSDIIRRLCDSGAGILMSSHILGNIDDLADRVLFIKDGAFVHGLGASAGTEAEYRQLFG